MRDMTRRRPSSNRSSNSSSSSSSEAESSKNTKSFYHSGDAATSSNGSRSSDDTLASSLATTPDGSSSSSSRNKSSSNNLYETEERLSRDNSPDSHQSGSTTAPSPLFVRVPADPSDLSSTHHQVLAALATLPPNYSSHSSPHFISGTNISSANDVTVGEDTMSYRYENVLRERLASTSIRQQYTPRANTSSSGYVPSTDVATGTPLFGEPNPSVLAELMAGKQDIIQGLSRLGTSDRVSTPAFLVLVLAIIQQCPSAGCCDKFQNWSYKLSF